MDEEITELDEELLPLSVNGVFDPDVNLALSVSVPGFELNFALWVDVPDAAGYDVGGLLVSVPYSP